MVKKLICGHSFGQQSAYRRMKPVAVRSVSGTAGNHDKSERSVITEMAQERTENRQVTFTIAAHLGVLARKKDGWNKELNLVSWNGANPPKFDIRDWSEDHRKMTKGITLYSQEMGRLCQYYQDFCNAKTVAESRFKSGAAAEAGIRAGREEREREEEQKALADEGRDREEEQKASADEEREGEEEQKASEDEESGEEDEDTPF